MTANANEQDQTAQRALKWPLMPNNIKLTIKKKHNKKEVKQNCLIRCKVAKYNSVVFNKLGIWII